MDKSGEITLAHLRLQREIEDFLHAEADLLDERRFEEWLDLLSDDVLYWVPMRKNVKFGEWDREMSRKGTDISWFEEGKTTLRLRVKQLMTGTHWSEEPVSRTSRLLTNIRIIEAFPSDEQPEEVRTKCRFLIYRNKLEDESDFFIGRREDNLRKIGGRWKIAKRTVLLDQNVMLAQTIPTVI